MLGGISKTVFIIVQVLMVVLFVGSIVAYDLYAPHPYDTDLEDIREDVAENTGAIEGQDLMLAGLLTEEEIEDMIDDAVDEFEEEVIDERFEEIDERLDDLADERYTAPSTGSVALSAIMVTSGVIEDAKTYTWNITVTNRTDVARLVHISGTFIANTITASLDNTATGMTVNTKMAAENYVPNAGKCIYMEFHTVGDSDAIHLAANQTTTVVVTLTIAYTSGSAIWDWSFSTM